MGIRIQQIHLGQFRLAQFTFLFDRYDQYQGICNLRPKTEMSPYVAQMSVLRRIHYLDLLYNEHMDLA